MRTLGIDIETFSSVDIKKAGLYKYAQSPDFEVLLFAWAFDDESVQIVDFTAGEELPFEVTQALFDSNITLNSAYNATFEWYCLSTHFKLSEQTRDWWLSQWRCTQLAGLYCGFPMGLGAISAAIGLPIEKQKLGTGGALIRTFCIPCKPAKKNGYRTRTLPHHEPEKWELFKTYCKGDVVAEREVAAKLKNFPIPASEQQLWEIDVFMNVRGVGVDMAFVDSAMYLSEQIDAELTKEAIALSGLKNPNSIKQLTKWLSEEMEEEVSDLTKSNVADMLKSATDETVKRMLELRQEMAKTSVKKYTAIKVSAGADDRMRGILQFYGANRTGRYSGRIFQPQNLPKNYLKTLAHARECVKARKKEVVEVIYGSIPDTLSQLIRTAVVPGEGNLFAVADFSAIEARIIAWLSGESWRQQVFATHGKIYEASASEMFDTPIELIVEGKPEYALRQRGKVAELGLGYGMGVDRFVETAAKQYKVYFTHAEAKDIIDRWRAASPRIVDLWHKIGNTAIDVVKYGRPLGVKGLIFSTVYDRTADLTFMVITLPNGRQLFYPAPSLTLNQWGRDELLYWGVDQYTKKWGQRKTYGASLVENIVQALARDCLCDKMLDMWYRGYKIVFHVHDEYVIEVEADKAEEVLQEALAIMREPIPWAPGLLLKGAGFTTPFYKKD